MLKKIATILGFALIMLTSASPAAAQFGLDPTASKAQYGSTGNIYSVISTVISLVLSFTGIIFLMIMFYGGLRWMTARGNEAKVTKAKEAMFAAIIGFVVVLAAYAITIFVFNKLTNNV